MSIDITPTTILAPFEAEHQAVNLTRNNKGSRWDRIGNNELISADQWRYNYNPDTGIFEGRTIMGQWTNEIKDPRDMTTGNWSAVNGTTVARDAVGIDGNANTACTLTASSVDSYVRQVVSISNDSNTHQSVVFVEKDSGIVRISIFLTGGTTEASTLTVDTSDGSVTGGSGTVRDEGNWWKLIKPITNNNSGNTTYSMRIYPDRDAGSGSTVFDVAGVFLNRSSPPPTPVYGETAGQSYTQDPDIATVTDLDAINFNPSEGTFVVEFNPIPNDESDFIYAVSIDDGSTSNRLYLGAYQDNAFIRLEPRDTFWQETTLGINYNQLNRAVFSYNFTDGINTKISLNGSPVDQKDDWGQHPTGLNIMRLGYNGLLPSSSFEGFMKVTNYYPRQLTDAEHQQEYAI